MRLRFCGRKISTSVRPPKQSASTPTWDEALGSELFAVSSRRLALWFASTIVFEINLAAALGVLLRLWSFRCSCLLLSFPVSTDLRWLGHWGSLQNPRRRGSSRRFRSFQLQRIRRAPDLRWGLV